MQNFSIQFLYPWLLLLILPAIGLTLYTHFTTMKRYRNTRNKIISIVLHTIVITLSILVLSGMQFHYEIRNDENELMVVVDLSVTQENARLRDPESEDYDPYYFLRDDFVETSIREAGYNNIKVGVMGFGLGQYYIAPLSKNIDRMYQEYERALELVSSELESDDYVDIDTSATDIKAALLYAAQQFEHPETAKILLITDGYETDESAITALQTLLSMGIRVDVVSFSGSYEDDGITISNVETPDYYFKAHDLFKVTVTIDSTQEYSSVGLRVYDYDHKYYDVSVDLLAGENTYEFEMMFEDDGLHELQVEVVTPIIQTNVEEVNNKYFKYIYMEEHDKVLILEHRAGDSDKLMEILDNASYKVKKLNLNDNREELPKNVNELRDYDQVILNNIASTDMGPAFIEMLDEYVKVHGGGLLTFGGTDDDGNLHAYNPADMQGDGKAYQEMLPVIIDSYRPPLGAMFIADVSGSMNSYISDVKEAITDCVREAVHDTDYVGLMTLSDKYTSDLQLTPASDKSIIYDSIRNFANTGGGTNFEPAVRAAITALNNTAEIANKHMVIFTDGQFFGSIDLVQWSKERKRENPDMTLTMVLLGSYSSAFTQAERIAEAWGGHTYVYNKDDEAGVAKLMSDLYKDLTSDSISGYKAEDFNPLANLKTSPVLRNVGFDLVSSKIDVTLNGYYGAKPRSSADLIVSGLYKVPVYSQWKYGVGNVGSFMCDIYGNYTKDFIEDPDGIKMIENIVSNVMPINNIRYSEIVLDLNTNEADNYNYYNSMNVYHKSLEEGETLVGRIEYLNPDTKETVKVSLGEKSEQTGDCYVLTAMNEDNNYTHVDFIMKKGGAYKIIVEKVNAEGTVLDSAEVYNSFAFSTEFDYNREDPAEMLAQLAQRTRGQVIYAGEPEAVIDGFVKAFEKSYDPRPLFLIIAMVCFLLDIAVRKFKFKWIHEIIRERKIVKEKK